jgi:RimJ/RimL family protein N-acetyltransferase
MGPFIFGADDVVSEWVKTKLPYPVKSFGPMTTIGIIRGDGLAAGAVFHGYRWPNIEVTFAGLRGWATRWAIETLANYAFREIKCHRITCITQDDNHDTRAFLERGQFAQEGIHPHFWPDGKTAISYGLYRNICRWISEDVRHGRS